MRMMDHPWDRVRSHVFSVAPSDRARESSLVEQFVHSVPPATTVATLSNLPQKGVMYGITTMSQR
jgi:hypothetical protein